MIMNYRELLAGISGGHVLDVATGRGRSILNLMNSLADYERITAIDTVDYRAEAEQDILNHPDVDFIQMDARSLDFPAGTFDTVHIAHSLHHLTELPKVLAEMLRVLKPRGYLLIDEMYRDHQNDKQRVVVNLHDWWADIDTRLGICHNHTLTRAEITDLIEPLDLVEVRYSDWANLETEESELVKIGAGGIDQYLLRAKDLPDYSAFEKRGEALRRRLQTTGAQLATTLLVTGKKDSHPQVSDG